VKIVVVEPHCDDAFLSLGGHLETLWKDLDRTIITVFGDAKRDQEARNYAEAIGAKSITLGLTESRMLSELRESLPIPELQETIRGLRLLPRDVLAFPLGLQHPDHYRVRDAATSRAVFYTDTPYWSKQKLGEEVRDRLKGTVIESVLFPHARKWRHIPIFQSQAKFFHFNDGLKTSRIPEIVIQGGRL